MKCMVCGKETRPSCPLVFCDGCRKNRLSEVEARRQKHREWFERIVTERDAVHL
jgi:hypothetical protein